MSKNNLAEDIDLEQKNFESKFFKSRNFQLQYILLKSLRKEPSDLSQAKCNKHVANGGAKNVSHVNK